MYRTSAQFAKGSDQHQQHHPNAEKRYPNQLSAANSGVGAVPLGILLDKEEGARGLGLGSRENSSTRPHPLERPFSKSSHPKSKIASQSREI